MADMKLNKPKILRLIPISVFAFATCLFVLSFFLQRHFMTDIDERDHLTAGYLMHEGKQLYKDIFTHHFPFPYYWTFLFTPFWGKTASRAVSVFRLSLLVLYLIAFLIILLCLKNKKSKYAFSLWIGIFSLFFTLYHGQLVLSETFSAIAIISIFWLTLPVMLNWEKFDFFKISASLFFAFIGFWTQPFLAFLFLIPTIMAPKNYRLKIILFSFFLNIVPLLFFFLSKQLASFWEQGIWFNFAVYSKYYTELDNSSLDLFKIPLLFLENQLHLLTHFSNPLEFSQFFVSLSFLFIAAIIIKTRNVKNILAFLLLFVSSHVREVKIFTGQLFNFGIFPFLAIASASFCQLMVLLLPKKKIITLLLILTFIGVSMINWQPIIKQSLKPEYNYHVFWSYRQDDGEIIKSLSLPKEKILIYPHDVDLYFFAQRQPPDRFLYWFPWTNSVGKYRQERLTALQENPPAVIYMGNLRFKEDPNFYLQFFPNLLNEYERISKNGKETNIWIRKDLIGRLKSPLSISGFVYNKRN